jgi:hypothetical protein
MRLSISQMQTRRGAKEVKIRSTSYERQRVAVMLWVLSYYDTLFSVEKRLIIIIIIIMNC